MCLEWPSSLIAFPPQRVQNAKLAWAPVRGWLDTTTTTQTSATTVLRVLQTPSTI